MILLIIFTLLQIYVDLNVQIFISMIYELSGSIYVVIRVLIVHIQLMAILIVISVYAIDSKMPFLVKIMIF